MGQAQNRKNKVPSLRALAAENVAQQLLHDYDDTVKTKFRNINQKSGGLDGAFQIARAEAIARQAANRKQNQLNNQFISGYEERLFSPPQHDGLRDEEGLTAQMRGKKRLMRPYLSDMYFSKLQRRANRANQPVSWLPGISTPEEFDAGHNRPFRPGMQFWRFVAEYLGMPASAVEGWVTTYDAIEGIANHFNIPSRTAETLIHTAWMKFKGPKP